MLSQSTITIIQSTVPVLQEKGLEITSTFYRNLFTDHPELLNVFNHSNQKKGKQQTALANTLYAAAANIDKLESILPVVVQTAHKHRSLQVKPEHYPIVGKYLLMAMKEVLKDAATEEVLTAWSEAYTVIADIFIGIEEKMYQEAETSTGWEGFKSFTVVDKVKESDVITSFYLQPKDNFPLPTFLPGQYITVRVQPATSEYYLNRQYSLSQAPGKNALRISVKKETNEVNGIVSHYLHDFIHVNDQLEITAPAGHFTLCTESHKPVYLLAGGVGITPLLSMFQQLHQQETSQKIHLVHATINGAMQGFKEEILTLTNKRPDTTVSFVYEKPTAADKAEKEYVATGYISKDMFQQMQIANDGEYYICGPLPFMKATYQLLKELHVSDECIHYEMFGPSQDLATVSEKVPQ